MAGEMSRPVDEKMPSESTSWVRVAALTDLPPGSTREIRLGSQVYALFHLGDSVHCLDGLCPHQGAHLASADLAESIITCPRVGCLRWRFNLRTGACLQHGRVRLRTYEVRSEGDALFIATGDPSRS